MSSTSPSLFGSTASVGSPTSVPSAVVSSLASLASVASASVGGSSSNGTTAATSDGSRQPIVRSQTPIFSCTPASYNISGGAPPYTAFIIRSGDANASIIHTLPTQLQAGTGSWGVDLQPGTSITFVAKDRNNATGYSIPVVIQLGSSTSCIAGDNSGDSGPAASHTGAIVGGVVGGICGLAIIGLSVWLLVVRPARQAKPKPAGFYDDEDDAHSRKTGGSPPHTMASAPVGSYNLGQISGMDYRAPSLPQDVQERLPLPRYDAGHPPAVPRS